MSSVCPCCGQIIGFGKEIKPSFDLVNLVMKDGGLMTLGKHKEAKNNLISKLHKQSIEGIDYTYKGLVEVINEVFGDKLKDKCEICKGTKGGVRGNENIVDGKLLCDYCHANQPHDLVNP